MDGGGKIHLDKIKENFEKIEVFDYSKYTQEKDLGKEPKDIEDWINKYSKNYTYFSENINKFNLDDNTKVYVAAKANRDFDATETRWFKVFIHRKDEGIAISGDYYPSVNVEGVIVDRDTNNQVEFNIEKNEDGFILKAKSKRRNYSKEYKFVLGSKNENTNEVKE